MIIAPKVRGFICTTTHPIGCKKKLEEQISYVRSQGKINSNFKRILIIGGSTGYGLATRIVGAFGWGADTLNISLERIPVEKPNEIKPASPGFYQTAYLEKLAREQGLYAESIIGDAFSNEIKVKAVEKIKEWGSVDLLIYSLAAPKRVDPKEGVVYQSVLKAIGKGDIKKSINPALAKITEIEVKTATEEEIKATIKVMGGEDWKLWVKELRKNQLLSKNFVTMAYSYIGPEITQLIYRRGTIGKAKKHLEQSAQEITNDNQDINGKAYISINKGLVTQASSAIPILPLYLSLLFKVMKDKNIHEDCIRQITRLFSEKMNFKEGKDLQVELDKNGFIRLDDWEMKEEVQNEVKSRWEKVNNENLNELSDVIGYNNDFLQLFGFGVEGIDYEQEVNDEDINVKLN